MNRTRNRRFVLYGLAALLVALALVSIELAAISWHGVGGRSGGAMTVVLLELGFFYLLVATALVARARGQLRGFLNLDRLHLLGTIVGFTAALPIGLMAGISSPTILAVVALFYGFVPTACYAFWLIAREQRAREGAER